MTSETKLPDWEDAHHAGHSARDAADQAWKANGQNQTPLRLIQTSAQFVAGFVSPSYLLDGILQRRFFYSLTARTGAGKTAILLLVAAHGGLGKRLGNREVERGRVLYLAGENPDDIRGRWIAMATEVGFDMESVDVFFIPGRFKITKLRNRVRAEIDQLGGVTLVIVDTSATYYESDDENNNVQMGAHARLLRSLTEMPGGPCVVAACHPIKNASDDNLVPRGGGAFVAEVDGNLTAIRKDNVVTLHWQVKYRGPDFAPITFELRTVTNEKVKDAKGRQLPTVVAEHLDEVGQAKIETTQRSREDQLLVILKRNPKASQAELARLCGWYMEKGEPYKSLVARTVAKLKRDKLVTETRDGIELTKAGREALGQSEDGDGKAKSAAPADRDLDMFDDGGR